MKAAVKALVALAAVFFSAESYSATFTHWFASKAESQAAALATGACCNSAGWNADNTFYSSVTTEWLEGGYANYHVWNGYAVNPCVAPEVVQESDGSCAAPPPAVDCSKDSGKKFTSKVSGAFTSDGSRCIPVSQRVDPALPDGPSNTVNGECQAVNVLTTPTFMLDTPSQGNVQIGEFMYTGESCTTSAETSAPMPTDNLPTQTCVTGASGSVACVDTKSPTNCGSINGERVCLDSVPPGNCTFFGSGNWVCDSSASSPPKPAVAPEMLAGGRAKNGQPATMQVFPPGAEGGDASSTYTGGSGDGQGGTCGGEGQPACKVDETGTPTAGESDFAGAKGALDGAAGDAAASGGDAPVSGGEAGGAVSAVQSAMPSGSCSPIIWTVHGQTMVIDLYDKCADFRAAAAWVLGLATAFYLLTLFLRSPVG